MAELRVSHRRLLCVILVIPGSAMPGCEALASVDHHRQAALPGSTWDVAQLLFVVLLLIAIGYVLKLELPWRRRERNANVKEAAPDTSAPSAVADKADSSPRSELAAALRSCRGAFISIGLFSGLINILMLTGAFFMLVVYDRVLPSQSVPTLIALAILVFVLFSAQGALDIVRNRILVRASASIDETLGPRIYETIVKLPLHTGRRGERVEPLRDLDTIRSFLTGAGPIVLFDLPWMPIYLAVIFALHVMLGWTALIGAVVLVALTLLTEFLTRAPMKDSSKFALARNSIAEASRRNADVLVAMGMAGRTAARWTNANRALLDSQQRMSDVAGGLGAVSKALRMMLQSAVLGVGAYFVVQQEATAGIIIAGAILAARALAPVDQAIANWKGFVAARQSWRRLEQLLISIPSQSEPMLLPTPKSTLVVEHASAVPPGEKRLVVHDINFALKAGQGLGVVGPSASGKSSLVRLLVGVWQPARGHIRLDGASLDQWSPELLGYHIGYLPQDVELFDGTVADNISRFEPNPTPDAVITAAQAAGVHDLITALEGGYETQIGEQGQALSAGQRQRIALARALYNDPFLVVLDEPNSNLDAEGEAALTQAVLQVRRRGGIVVVVAHRQAALAGVDMLLAINQGQSIAFGQRDEVLSKIVRSRGKGNAPSRNDRDPPETKS